MLLKQPRRSFPALSLLGGQLVILTIDLAGDTRVVDGLQCLRSDFVSVRNAALN